MKLVPKDYYLTIFQLPKELIEVLNYSFNGGK